MISGNGKQQGARRGDDDNGEESFRVAASQSGGDRYAQRERGILRAKLIAEAAQLWALLFGFMLHFHDAGVARIIRQFFRADR